MFIFLLLIDVGKKRMLILLVMYYVIKGCSCILKLCKRPELIQNLNKKEEGTIFHSINLNEK